MSNIVSVNMQPFVAAVIASVPHHADRRRMLAGVGAAAMHQWKKLALEQLNSTARDYVAGLSLRTTVNRAVITLEGKKANWVEQGLSAYDMKQTHLNGPGAKRAKDGSKYATIPFQHGTPGTSGKNVGATMPKPIHNAVKKLKPTLTRSGTVKVGRHGGVTAYGERLSPKMKLGAMARKILNRKAKPWHSSSIYNGMIRQGKKNATGKVVTTGYMTFRRISSKSDPRAWQHPGIKARHLAKQVQSYINGLANDIITAAASDS